MDAIQKASQTWGGIIIIIIIIIIITLKCGVKCSSIWKKRDPGKEFVSIEVKEWICPVVNGNQVI